MTNHRAEAYAKDLDAVLAELGTPPVDVPSPDLAVDRLGVDVLRRQRALGVDGSDADGVEAQASERRARTFARRSALLRTKPPDRSEVAIKPASRVAVLAPPPDSSDAQ